MTTPQWIASEQRRIRRERWLTRIEGAAGIVLGAGLFVAAVRIALGLMR